MLIEKILFDDFEKIVELNYRNNLTTLQRTDWENLWKKNYNLWIIRKMQLFSDKYKSY